MCWPIFQTKKLIYQSKAKLDKGKDGKMTQIFDPEIKKILVGELYGRKNLFF